MKRCLAHSISCVALLLALPFPATAHEFWMLPEPFILAPGETTQLTMHVGEQFVGDLVPFSTRYVESLRHYAKGRATDLEGHVPAGMQLPALRLAIETPGSHMVAFDSNPSQVTLSADKFHAYLREEGLEHIIVQRDRAKQAETPGRERFRRHVKTLVRVGEVSDDTYAARTGQRLEIVPSSDPLAARAGDTLLVQLLFDGQPLAGALVKAWHKRGRQTLIVRVSTDAEGKAAFDMPYGGAWMISVVHMLPAADGKDIDWDSHWGNLTFELRERTPVP